MKLLTDLAQRIFLERENVRLLPDESLTMQSLIAVGTSAGGRQPKAIIAINPETREIRSGQIAGHKGFDYCILKFGDAERSSAELEMAYYKMARAAGISMMPCRIIEIEGQKHFITHRLIVMRNVNYTCRRWRLYILMLTAMKVADGLSKDASA